MTYVHVASVTTHADGSTSEREYLAECPGHTGREAYRRRLARLRDAGRDVATEKHGTDLVIVLTTRSSDSTTVERMSFDGSAS